MKTPASYAFALASAIALFSARVAVASLVSEQSETSTLAQIHGHVLWAAKPRRIDPSAQSLERLPPRYSTYAANEHLMRKYANVRELGETAKKVQRAVAPEASLIEEKSASGAAAINLAAQNWCADHYRSYDASNNTYTAFSGQVRLCKSPFSVVAQNAVTVASN